MHMKIIIDTLLTLKETAKILKEEKTQARLGEANILHAAPTNAQLNYGAGS